MNVEIPDGISLIELVEVGRLSRQLESKEIRKDYHIPYSLKPDPYPLE